MPFGPLPPKPTRRVAVTGIGLVTPLGTTANSTFTQLCKGKVGTRPLRESPFFLPSCITNSRSATPEQKEAYLSKLIDVLPCKVAAPVLGDGEDPTLFAPTPHEPRAFRFSESAVREALIDAKLLAPDSSPQKPSLSFDRLDRLGVNIGMGIPSLSDVSDVSHYLYAPIETLPSFHPQYSKINPFFVPKILGNMAAGTIAIRYGCKGPIGSSVSACATGAHCIGESMEWIRHARADVMICGATESSINAISLSGFSRMRALCTKYNYSPSFASRPFDRDRAGFIIGEGSGILILEEMEQAIKRLGKNRVYAELRGFGVSCDAHHVAAPHPQGKGAAACIQHALHDSGNISPMAIGYINAHATGTIGDDIELNAIHSVLLQPSFSRQSFTYRESDFNRTEPLYVSSTKGALGHLLGAAGSVEAALSVLSLKNNQLLPTANLSTPTFENPTPSDSVNRIELVRFADNKSSKTDDNNIIPACTLNTEAVMSTSFGFGGINTALLFTKI